MKATSFAKGTPNLDKNLPKSDESPIAADPDAKKPAAVIPTCMVDKNLEGSFNRSNNILAFYSFFCFHA